jgi:LPXTG-site transpeptidase (sortase) family protein
VRRALGVALMGAGTALIVATALAAQGVLPVGRPSVPAPPEAVLAVGRGPGAAAPGGQASAPPREPPAPLAAAASTVPPSPPPPAPLLGPIAGGDDAEDPALASAEPTARSSPTPRPTATLPPSPTLWPSLTPWPSSTPWPSPTPRPTPVPPPPAPGLPLRLAIPSIQVNTAVVELDTRVDDAGNLEWDTVPFVAGYYGLTGLVGANANVVVSGHVTTQGMGNVFRDLYQLLPGEPIVVHTAEGEFTYQVEALRLVKPTEVDVLTPTAEPHLTLVTCAGEYDFRTRSFSQRLVVVGRLVTPSLPSPPGRWHPILPSPSGSRSADYCERCAG